MYQRCGSRLFQVKKSHKLYFEFWYIIVILLESKWVRDLFRSKITGQPYMDSDSNESIWPPPCWCRTGQMVLLQAFTLKNPGRYFYKCPRNLKHPRNFIWCDKWHQHDSPNSMPEFLKYQNPPSTSYLQQSTSPHFNTNETQLHEGSTNVSSAVIMGLHKEIIVIVDFQTLTTSLHTVSQVLGYFI
ncbi:hypothetical protein ACS0TY_033263 [Phlomoides rotata]